jgi:hypothetical protein
LQKDRCNKKSLKIVTRRGKMKVERNVEVNKENKNKTYRNKERIFNLLNMGLNPSFQVAT